MPVALVVVAVAIELGFFQQEKEQQTAEQGHEKAVRVDLALKSFGQHQQQGRAQQHAH